MNSKTLNRQLVKCSASRLLSSTAILLSLVVAGCGGGNDGPKRYQLSGTVTFEGKPIPVGTIYFNPDNTKGNNGPGSAAEIKNGNYKTPPEGGLVGGPMIVKIDGFEGISKTVGGEVIPNGMALFPTWEGPVEIEKKNGKKDFVVDKATSTGAGGGSKPFIY